MAEHKVAVAALDRHRVISEMRPEMAKAGRVKTEIERQPCELLKKIGLCLVLARGALGWNLDDLASHLPPPPGKDRRDPRQVRRWEDGEERLQLDAVLAVEALREPFTLQLAKLSGADVQVSVRFRRMG